MDNLVKSDAKCLPENLVANVVNNAFGWLYRWLSAVFIVRDR